MDYPGTADGLNQILNIPRLPTRETVCGNKDEGRFQRRSFQQYARFDSAFQSSACRFSPLYFYLLICPLNSYHFALKIISGCWILFAIVWIVAAFWTKRSVY